MKLKTLLILSLFSASCASPIPKWDGKIYAGSHETESVFRNVDDFIKCGSVMFDDMVCMSMDDFQKFVETYVSGCREWK